MKANVLCRILFPALLLAVAYNASATPDTINPFQINLDDIKLYPEDDKELTIFYTPPPATDEEVIAFAIKSYTILSDYVMVFSTHRWETETDGIKKTTPYVVAATLDVRDLKWNQGWMNSIYQTRVAAKQLDEYWGDEIQTAYTSQFSYYLDEAISQAVTDCGSFDEAVQNREKAAKALVQRINDYLKTCQAMVPVRINDARIFLPVKDKVHTPTEASNITAEG